MVTLLLQTKLCFLLVRKRKWILGRYYECIPLGISTQGSDILVGEVGRLTAHMTSVGKSSVGSTKAGGAERSSSGRHTYKSRKHTLKVIHYRTSGILPGIRDGQPFQTA